jgi:hypothetical protein
MSVAARPCMVAFWAADTTNLYRVCLLRTLLESRIEQDSVGPAHRDPDSFSQVSGHLAWSQKAAPAVSGLMTCSTPDSPRDLRAWADAARGQGCGHARSALHDHQNRESGHPESAAGECQDISSEKSQARSSPGSRRMRRSSPALSA